jgi:succinoglycan biosynthesis transport protein ExoP
MMLTLRDYLRIVRRNIIVIVALVLCGFAGGLVFSAVSTPSYSASAKVFVSTAGATSVTDLTQSNDYSQQIIASYAEVATTPYVLNAVSERLAGARTVAQLASAVTASSPSNTSVLQVTVEDRSPRIAAEAANAVTAQLKRAVESLTPNGTSSASTVRLTQIQPAEVPSTPSSPHYGINVVVGILTGLLVGVLVAALRNQLDTKLRSVAELQEAIHVPLLGTIHLVEGARSDVTPLVATGEGTFTEAFRTLQVNLRYTGPATSFRSYVVTSSIQGEGKSTTAVNLARVIANAGERVILVDADLRRPRVADYLGIDGSLGLSDVLSGQVLLADALQTTSDGRMSVLPSGAVPPNPSELLQGAAMDSLIKDLAARADVVIFDTPPLVPVADATILALRSTGAIVLTGLGRVRRPQLQSALSRMATTGAVVLGIVANRAPNRGVDAYNYDYRLHQYTVDTSNGAAMNSA